MTKKPTLLLVDDDNAFRKVYGNLLRTEGYEVFEADDRPSADAAFKTLQPDVVLLDLMLPPDGSARAGLEQLTRFISQRPAAKIIVVSGVGDTRFMLQAVGEGAYDFLTKPADPDVVLVVVARAIARVQLEKQITSLQNQLTNAHPQNSMLGQSPAFLAALDMAERVAPTDLPVLVTGENGTGKELMARTVHEKSRRAKAPFIAVNCGALPENLLESALFGHTKGAFTGATSARPGLFAEAHTGTLFLDEIGDTPPHLQVKLLRALEYGEILPVGADRPIHVDVRLVSATNRDLLALQTSGEFREDLYWRIKGTEIHLPSLRERPTDIPLLATFFLNNAASLTPDGQSRRLSPEAETALMHHPWPGNLRELRHEMQRATVMARSPEILPTDLSFANTSQPQIQSQSQPQTLQEKLEALERHEIQKALQQAAGNRTHAADALGLSRQGLLNKITRYNLEP